MYHRNADAVFADSLLHCICMLAGSDSDGEGEILCNCIQQ